MSLSYGIMSWSAPSTWVIFQSIQYFSIFYKLLTYAGDPPEKSGAHRVWHQVQMWQRVLARWCRVLAQSVCIKIYGKPTQKLIMLKL